MPDFLRGSLIISFILKIISVFANAYKLSVLKKFADKTNLCFKESKTYKILRKYLYKEPFYRYSLTYKIVFKIAYLIDKAFGGIFKIIKSMLFGSSFSDSFARIYNMSLTDKCYFAGGLLISIPVGAVIASIVLNNFNAFTFIICWAMFFVGVMVVIIGIYGKDSILVKLFRGFIQIIK